MHGHSSCGSYIAQNTRLADLLYTSSDWGCSIELVYFVINNQRDAALSSLIYYLLRNHSTCSGRSLHPSSGVNKTVVKTIGTSHAVNYKGIM